MSLEYTDPWEWLIFSLQEWLTSNFSLQYHPWIKHKGHKNKGNDHQLKKLLIVKQVHFVSTSRKIQRTVWRICNLGSRDLPKIHCHISWLFLTWIWLDLVPPKRRHKQNIAFIYCTIQSLCLLKFWKSLIIWFKDINWRHHHWGTFQKFFPTEFLVCRIVVEFSFLNVSFIQSHVIMWFINEQLFCPADLKGRRYW